MAEGERYIPKAVRSGEPFLSTQELAKKVDEEWTQDAAVFEPALKDDRPVNYPVTRTEGNKIEGADISGAHFERFIAETIPRLIAENPDRKIKIIDIGGGAALFAKQIRDAFGDKVEVFTTGLKKKAAKMARAKEGLSEKLDKNDLKWRSILQLHDFPEFDLMVDTFGEFFMGDKTLEGQMVYITTVIKKMALGGHASIWAGYLHHKIINSDILRKMEIENGVKIEFVELSRVLKIDKPKEIEQK